MAVSKALKTLQLNVLIFIEGDRTDYQEDLESQGYSGVDENDELTSLSDDEEDDYLLDDEFDDDEF